MHSLPNLKKRGMLDHFLLLRHYIRYYRHFKRYRGHKFNTKFKLDQETVSAITLMFRLNIWW